jgi:hypothetical protein
MKHLRWMPLTFLAGAHGFALFAPYVAIMLTLEQWVRYLKKSSLAAAKKRN